MCKGRDPYHQYCVCVGYPLQHSRFLINTSGDETLENDSLESALCHVRLLVNANPIRVWWIAVFNYVLERIRGYTIHKFGLVV
ncbi:hypothetical protein Y032_0247g60 [Ancylostoma ceylanicum]|uniref:Uncharacterized protein n=1 Tax=Ancylostoma ceylanicum TaxID=53326 RepID=A0A016SDS0_9BILA|nr:hypothetical protein Y032_0247g60 [Ancylostoma ceylanicum]